MKNVPITSASLLLCTLALTACAGTPEPEPPLLVQPVLCECPKLVSPPPELMKRPTVKRFLPQT